MNLPADDQTGQGAESPAAGPGGAGAATTRAPTGDAGPAPAAAPEAARAAAARRAATRRILDEVFGDLLPTVTRDELDDGSDSASGGRDQWYRDNRPPHHS